ncbi:MAG: hypothetical protein WAQ53_10635 [Thiofilum sp.]|uniref:hypothetical protein n=1 Tax=Thiofilum sp. TaxID=2212733 RepID=UPI0025F5F42F|nr:hypothetical protein [Thiofilum sp.]MBK8453317.1 hypothetical protein [Thiofilum sp.]
MLENIDFSKYQSWAKNNKYVNSLRPLHKNYLPWLFICSEERAQEQIKLLSQSIDALNLPLSKLVSGSKEHKDWETNQRSYQQHKMALVLLSDQLALETLANLCFPFHCQLWAKQIFKDSILKLIEKEILAVALYPWQSEPITSLNIKAKPYMSNINSIVSNKERIHKLLELPSFLAPYTQIKLSNFLEASHYEKNLEACARIWEDYLYNSTTSEIYIAPAFNEDSLETVNGYAHLNHQLIDNTPDSLPIPWLFKPNERKARFVGEMLEAAYRLYRARHHRNPQDKNFSELFDLLTPQDLPDFVSERSTDSKTSSIEIKLKDNQNNSYQYKNFLTTIKQKIINI